MFAVGNFFVTSISKGDRHGGGGRHRMASAVSQQAGGCFVVKASEKSCGTAAKPPPAGATFDVFCNRKVPDKVQVVVQTDEGTGGGGGGPPAAQTTAPSEGLVSSGSSGAPGPLVTDMDARLTAIEETQRNEIAALEAGNTTLTAENKRLREMLAKYM